MIAAACSNGLELTDPARTRLAPEDDLVLVARLRDGDDQAFESLVRENHGPLVRVAAACCDSRERAEQLAADTWRAALAGLDAFDGRTSLRSWIFGLLWESAGTEIPEDDDRPALDPSRFLPPDSAWPGHWAAAPVPWDNGARAAHAIDHLEAAIERLPLGQRLVIELRDVDGWTTDEVSSLLGLSATRQATLLHRARAAVRASLARALTGEGG
jgi:RNA polymerase sigma-70 factor (ECF subfamily)